MSSWDIVFWAQENAVDFVPSSWGNKDKTKYKYPTIPSESKRRQMIYDCDDITDKQFTWYDAVCKKANIRNISLAKDLCEKGQFTSTFETENEVDDDKDRCRSNNVQKTTVQIHSARKNQSSSSDESDDETDNAATKYKKKHTFTRPVINVLQNSSLTTPKLGGTRRDSPIAVSKKNGGDSQESGSKSSSISSHNSGQQDFLMNHGSLLSLKFELTEINSRLDRIENLLRVKNSSDASEIFADNNFCINNLPAKTVEELDVLNSKINEEPEKLHELLNFLYLLGGESIQKTIYLIMNKIFHKELAVLYSGQGRKKKLDFSQTKLYEVVMEATRKRHKSATNEQMKKAIGLYLASAQARLKN